MSSISSGVGLISGLPIQDLVNSLLLVQQRPITLLQNRVGLLTNQRTALLSLSAQILSIQNSATRLADANFFQSTTAASSNEAAILATANTGATPGEFTFTVRNLATTQQLISAGFASEDTTPLGAGTLTIESGAGLLNRPTELSSLHGGAGIQAGKIRITDRAGGSAVIDLVGAQTVDDVLSAINSDPAIQISASIEKDHLVIKDLSGGSGDLTIQEAGQGHTAADLGILKTVAGSGGDLVGDNIVSITQLSRLSRLNDGNGIRTLSGLNDLQVSLADGLAPLTFNLSDGLRTDLSLALLNDGAGVPDGTIRITDRAGHSADITLSAQTTVQDVLDAINNDATIQVTASISGSHFVVSDQSIVAGQVAVGDLTIEDVGGTTAEALGLVGSAAGSTLTGKNTYSVNTVDDLLRIINLDPTNNGRLSASISADGLGITLQDNTTGAGTFAVTDLNNSSAADDLGLTTGVSAGNTLTSSRLVSQLNTVLLKSLNGGRGVDLSGLIITDRAGVVHDFSAAGELSGAQTLSDLIGVINNAPTAVTASISASGLGIELRDTSGQAGNLTVTGSTASDLNIAADAALDTISSGNLQRRYLSEATRLADLNHGDGAKGKFRITDSNGQTAIVDLTQGDEVTLQDVINEINSRPTAITARINDSGDGLLLEDTSGGSRQISVTEEGGNTAAALGIKGQAAAGQTFIDGSLETQISISASDTLNDLLAKIRSSNADVNASIINDGSPTRPFRLSLTSTRSGRGGELAIDAGTTQLTFDTLTQAQDATVIFGDPNADIPLVLSASSNTLTNAIKGVRLDLIASSNQPVTISVQTDTEAIVQEIQTFVDNFNTVISSLDDLTSFDPETEARGILQGDSTARRIRSTLIDLTGRSVAGLPPSLDRLSRVGVTLSNGSTLTLDEAALRKALETDPEGVKNLFAFQVTDDQGETTTTGIGGVIQTELKRLTDEDNGVISLKDESLQSSKDNLNNRIDQLTLLMDKRRERLLAQFNATEQIIASLQNQQIALSSIGQAASTLSF